MKPRRRYFTAVAGGLALLYAAATVLQVAAGHVRRSKELERIAALEKAVADLRARPCVVPTLSSTASSSSTSLSSSNASRRDDEHDSPHLLRPRLLGSGVSGAWRYSDLRFPSGEVRRYYVRRDADTTSLARLAASIRADLADDIDLSR